MYILNILKMKNIDLYHIKNDTFKSDVINIIC